MATKRHGGDKRGSAATRRARKFWMLSPEAGFGGNGETVPCALGCGRILTFATIEADRIIPGGSYRRGNVRPGCKPCNLERSDNADAEITGRFAYLFTAPSLSPALGVA